MNFSEEKAVEELRAENEQLKASLEKANEINRRACEDWAEDDTHIRNAAKLFLTEFEINGDKFGVPPFTEIVDRICAMLAHTQGQRNQAQQELETVRRDLFIERDAHEKAKVSNADLSEQHKQAVEALREMGERLNNLRHNEQGMREELLASHANEIDLKRQLSAAQRVAELKERVIDNRPLCPDCRDKTKSTDECLRCESQRLKRQLGEVCVVLENLLDGAQAVGGQLLQLPYHRPSEVVKGLVLLDQLKALSPPNSTEARKEGGE